MTDTGPLFAVGENFPMSDLKFGQHIQPERPEPNALSHVLIKRCTVLPG